jgi:hypothetical protein
VISGSPDSASESSHFFKVFSQRLKNGALWKTWKMSPEIATQRCIQLTNKLIHSLSTGEKIFKQAKKIFQKFPESWNF